MKRTTRPIGRLVAIAGVLILGIVSAWRLPIAFQPAWSLPELRVDLTLPESSDLDEITRRWVLPLESSIRAIGGVRGTDGEVDATGAGVRVRFQAGTDPGRKAARLESELLRLRRQLPAGSRLTIWPTGQGAGDESSIVWLDTETTGEIPSRSRRRLRVDRNLIETLRELPEVRSVEVAGEARREIRIRARHAGTPAAVLASAVDRGLRFACLGQARAGGRRLPVVVAGRRHLPFGEQPIRLGGSRRRHAGDALVPLRAVADIDLREEEPLWIAHLGGVRGIVLFISREVEASPLALERSLRRTFAGFGLTERARSLIDEAAPLELLLVRLLSGVIAATTVAASISWWLFGGRAARWQTAALPIALAAACIAFRLTGFGLDVTTLPALSAGLGCALFFTAFRAGAATRPSVGAHGGAPATVHDGATAMETVAKVVIIVASALVLPIAVGLAGGALAPLLAAPVRAFAVALSAAVGALWLLPPLPRTRTKRAANVMSPRRGASGTLKWTLRNPWTVLLGTVVAGYLLLVLSGRALVPRQGDLAPAIGDLQVSLRFAEGATSDQAAGQVSAVEAHLDAMDEVESHWSVFTRGRGRVVASVRRQDRPLNRLSPIARQLQAQLSSVGASARVEPLASGGGGGGGDQGSILSESLEDRPETDKDVTFYRFILRHTDVEALQLAHGLVMDRLAGLKSSVWYRQIHTDWARPSTRVELVPRPGVSPEDATVAARAVAQGAILPAGRPLAAELDLQLRVIDPDAPRDRDQVVQRAELLRLRTTAADMPVVPSALLEAREVVSSPAVRRQSGRFVLPITLTVTGSIKAERKSSRARIDRALGALRLPAGTVIERPELNPAIWNRERLRMLAIAGALPALFFALAVCRLNSVWSGLATLIPPALGVAASAPWIQAAQGHLDELTLLLLAAALAGSFPVALEAAGATTAATLAAGATYRWLARHASGFAVAVPALLALLVVPGVGLDNDRHPWVLPLRVAGVAATVTCLASFLCLPVLLRTVRRALRRTPASPAAWRPPVGAHGGAPARGGTPAQGSQDLVLHARNLTKVYRGGFRALHAVDFRLEPGIVGLLGPNGAGKTTLLRLLCGLLEPSRGQVRFRGVPLSPANLSEYRRLVGFLPQGFNAYEGFTGADFLDYWAIERGLTDRHRRRREVERVLAQVGLEDAAGRKVRDFSGGMRRRIGIARALLGSPPIVIVDEPTTGLDVESRNRLRETLLAVAGERIILFSTHIASDVAAAASRILLLDNGHLAFDGPALELIARARGRVFEALIEDHDLPDFSSRFRVTTRIRTLQGLKVRAIVHHDRRPAGELVEPNLEEAYLAMIGAPGDRRDEGRQGRSGALLDLKAWDSRSC